MKDKKVFLADDSKAMREAILESLLRLEIAEVKIAENGKQAVELLKAEALYDEAFNLILLDINMPGFTGIQVLKIIRTIKAYESTPVLMVSTENEKEVVLEAIISGANDYILKPFDHETFKEKVLKYII